jgi:hypothetical protein
VALITKSFHWQKSFDNSLDGAHPLGDKAPVALTATWGDLTTLVALIGQQTTGSAFSHNIRQYVQGTGASTATLALESVSGDNAATEGWSIAGDTLTHPGAQTGAGVFRLSATIDGVTNYSSPLTWAWIDPPIVIPPATNAIKWRPGHFIGTYLLNNSDANAFAGQITEVAGIKHLVPEVLGIGLWFTWRFLEPTRGNYSGIATLVSACDALRAAGLYAWIFVVDDTWAGTQRYAPDYLTSESGASGGIYNKVNGGTTPKLWNAAVMDRDIALWQQLGAALDTHRAVEVVSYRELDTGFGGNEFTAAGFSYTAYHDQLHRWVDATKAAFAHTNIAAPANFSGQQSLMAGWVKYCYDRGVGCGGPDIYPQDPYRYGGSGKGSTWSDAIHRGLQWNGTSFVAGGTDYRGKMFYASQVQDPDMGRGYTWPPRAFYEYAAAIDGLAQSHMMWWRKDYPWTGTNFPAASAQTYWTNTVAPTTLRIKSFLQSGGHPMRATPPTFYNGNVDTAA